MDIDVMRELAPFAIGVLAVPPLALLAMRQSWSALTKFAVVLVLSIIFGTVTSYLAGEFVFGMPTALFAGIVDTSLVYTGSQLAWKLVWKPILALTRPDKPSTVARRQK